VADALLVAVLVALLLLAVAGWAAAFAALRALGRAKSAKRSQSTRYGQLSESFAPWMRAWPFPEPGRFRFLGDPIDGVAFEDDAVYLVEIKTAGARLQPRQRVIREMVGQGRVGWVTFHVNDERAPEVIRPWEAAPATRRR
jgi:predicted Holliday junction resolvase-like endonuclease